MEAKHLEPKTIRITGKRQLTIPKEYYDVLGMNNVAKCYLEGKRIIIEPIAVRNDGDFSEELLAELISRGLHGKELLDSFTEYKRRIKENIDEMYISAQKTINEPHRKNDMDDVFGEE